MPAETDFTSLKAMPVKYMLDTYVHFEVDNLGFYRLHVKTGSGTSIQIGDSITSGVASVTFYSPGGNTSTFVAFNNNVGNLPAQLPMQLLVPYQVKKTKG